MRVVMNQLFHRLGTVVDHLQEDGPALRSDAGQRADDGVVNVIGELARIHRFGTIWIEEFQEMAKALALRLDTKFLVSLQRLAVDDVIVLKSDAIEAQVGAEMAL